MIFLSNIRDYVKSLGIGDNFYIGKLDNKQEKSIGIYQLGRRAPVSAIGGLSSYEVKSISILIHWTKNADETEKAAFELYKKLEAAKKEVLIIGSTQIQFINMLQSEPVDVGTDDNLVYERVIEIEIYYRKDDF